jgi:hypothetical protein
LPHPALGYGGVVEDERQRNWEMLLPFLLYCVLIASGLAFYIVVGLTHR